jgi:hypothetical protein
VIHDQKPVELTLRPSFALLYWITLVHFLSISTVLFLGLFLGLYTIISAVLLLVISVSFFHGHRQQKKPPWQKIIYDGADWGLIPSDISLQTSSISVVKAELCHYYRFGNRWILSFRRLGLTFPQTLFQVRTNILLLPDGCDKDGLRQLRQLLLTKNRFVSGGAQGAS